MNKIKIDKPVIVEGKYDKAKLSTIIDACIMTTDGFGIFTDKEKQHLFSRIAAEQGLVVITDSDRAGFKIRGFLKGIAPNGITQIILPAVEGKERRKAQPSKQGLLGIEGTDAQIIRETLRRYGFTDDTTTAVPNRKSVTKTDFYEDGLSGREGSTEKRRELAVKMKLPPDMSATALLEAVNLLVGFDEYKSIIRNIGNQV